MILNCGKYSVYFGCRLFSVAFPRISDMTLDWEYFLNRSNHEEIIENAKRRGVKQNIADVLQKINAVSDCDIETKHSILKSLNENKKLREQIAWLPNKTHPAVFKNLTDDPVLLGEIGSKLHFSYSPATFDNMSKYLNLIRTKFLGHITGNKSYFLKNDLALLERALVKFTLHNLLSKGFIPVSVPDIVSKAVFEGCGMKTEGQHSQVFHIDESWGGKDLCLSGTAEMSLAAYLAQKTFRLEELPLRLCSVSRCYRAEAKRRQTEKGIFRVHAFTKVEMFGVTSSEEDESEKLMEEFVEIQKRLFHDMGLHFKVLEMPVCDLGLPAYHKIDIEAWMPGRNIYGEISSASNCTDYQSRRLNIKYVSSSNLQEKFCHTVNGTACAVPRMLIAIFENFQNLNASVSIPSVLQPFFNKTVISEKFTETFKCMKPTG